MTPTDEPGGSDPAARDGGGRSGRLFVLACVLFCLALVAVIVFVSPRLLEATLANAPPRAPVQVAEGEVDGVAWSATAVEPEDEQPCLRLDVDGERAGMLCGHPDASSGMRALEAVPVGDDTLIGVIVDPRTTNVRVSAGPEEASFSVSYADFGFPMGFVAGPVPTPVTEVTGVGGDGRVRGRADCTLDGDDHDRQRHVMPPMLLGVESPLGDGDGCLLVR